MSFVKQIPSQKFNESKKVEIHLVRGKSMDGTSIYAYLAIYTHRVRDFLLSLKLKNTDLEDHGVIVASGEGEPDEIVKRHIEKTYFSS